MFPNGVTHITDQLAFLKENGQVVYFNGHMPVFSHAESDIASFRMITSQFCANGYVKQADIIRTFGVTSISVKRWVKKFREEGPRGFYAPRPVRGAAVLVEDVVAKAEELLADGGKISEVAEKLGVKKNTLQKAVRAGKVREPIKKTARRCTLSGECYRRGHQTRLCHAGEKPNCHDGTAGGERHKPTRRWRRRLHRPDGRHANRYNSTAASHYQKRARRSGLCRPDGTRGDRDIGATSGEPRQTRRVCSAV